jgi:diacylglycerol kinase (ATP)
VSELASEPSAQEQEQHGPPPLAAGRAVTGQVAVLANPTAGRGRHRALLTAVVERLGGHGHDVRLLDAGTAGEAEAACHAAVAGGAAAVVAVGGDGTLHRALQAVAGTQVPLGIVPAGTGNDFAYEVGMPADPLAAADLIADGLSQGRTRAVDLAQVTAGDNQVRWYAAVLAAGFDAVVNELANRMRWPRGPRRYDLAIVLELARLRPRHYTLRLDGEPIQMDAVLVAVGNTASYGGGLRICPEADPTDGLLDVVVGGRLGRAAVVRLKPKLYQGTHLAHPLVTSFRARQVVIETDGVVGYADGERSTPLPVTVTCVPGALRLL